MKNVNFANFTGKHQSQSVFFNIVAGQAWACNFIKKEILAQVFFCEICESFMNTFFTEHLQTTASEKIKGVKAPKKLLIRSIYFEYGDR